MMNENYYVSAQGVLGLRTNVAGFKWSWGVGMPAVSRSEYEACAVRLRLVVGDVQPRPNGPEPEHPAGKYHYFSGIPGADSLSYERTLLGKHKLRFRIEGLLSDEPTLYVNPAYLRFVTHRFMNLHSAGYILTDVVGLLLLRAGYVPLHCSAFKKGDSTVLVLAPSNTGKTLTTMIACLEHGADFLAEDLAISDGTTLFSVPWTSTFRYYDRVDSSRRSRVLNRVTAIVPPLELLPLTKIRGVDTLISGDHLMSQAKITNVAVLERGHESVREGDRAEILRKAVNLNRYEFNYVKAPTLVAYEFFNPDIDLDQAALQERRLMAQIVDTADRNWIVSSMDATHYAPLLLDQLNG
jgi:hypothetical protein